MPLLSCLERNRYVAGTIFNVNHGTISLNGLYRRSFVAIIRIVISMISDCIFKAELRGRGGIYAAAKKADAIRSKCNYDSRPNQSGEP